MRWYFPGVLLILTAIVVVALWNNGVFEDEDSVFSLCPADRTSTTPVRPSQMLDKARPYTGPGPHRIIIDTPDTLSRTNALPVDWVPQRTNNHYRLETLELVACEYRHAIGHEGDVGSCGYGTVGGERGWGYSVTTQSAKYDYRVFEAATGRLLTTFTVKGVHTPCTEGVRVLPFRPSPHTSEPALPDFAELKRQLEPLVTRPVA